ncbi:methyltransferase domain-containing protein [Streptantibioticus rubrisoli]|uniref:Methyltransferase domain-containing protein n=1 Tax=Streptantibioticus rubrisoli TaxID=1387313 RepID=A0ABT1P7T0_9ACTN|nr:class I SAM-dependent methyltransferase [Streptantibioticus rubrisoli]MCQ4040831.1 methyltransferase domain-containing protein [Streptantibioticus rubrisoli]
MDDQSTVRAADAARGYYETADVDGFYASVWGGEDIHTGIYAHPREAIGAASRRTVERVAAKAADLLGPGRRVLDMGSGYGGAARYLAERFGCRVVALNISESQNRRHREANAARGLGALIEVVTGSFNDVPEPDGSFDVVWSQEALCHSGDRAKTLGEAARVLKPGGAFVFTDIMATPKATAEELAPLAERLAMGRFATLDFYRARLGELGLAPVEFEDLSEHLLTHYIRLTEEVREHGEELAQVISPGYLERLGGNLPLWARASQEGHLAWGIFHAVCAADAR